MKNDRLLVTLDDPYAQALGLALFCFARLEWDAVHCCEKMKPGFINDLGRRTAGMIAAELIQLASARPDWSTVEAQCLEFKRLVVVRNEIMHGKPGSLGAEREQRLFHLGSPWTIEKVNKAADEFTACQIHVNDFLHKVLSN